MNEAQLGAVVWGKVNEIANKVFGVEIPPEECRSARFPSFYTYYYPYYFRYLAQAGAAHDSNDFNDFAHAVAAPYCAEFYTEQTLANVLRKQIKGRRPPTPLQTAKALAKVGAMSSQKLEQIKRDKQTAVENAPLLIHTEIVSFAEMLKKLRDVEQTLT